MNQIVPILSFILINLVGQRCVAETHTLGTAFNENNPLDKVWLFHVYLDDKAIGTHRFVLQEDNGLERITSRAEFKYTLFGITLYRYEHENSETWKDGCLQDIFSRTDDNGDRIYVKGAKQEDGFFVESLQKTQQLPDCVQTFAYWDKNLLQDTNLLNSQNAEFMPVTLRSTKQDPDNTNIETLTLETSEGEIHLRYESDRWISLETRTEDGRELRYVESLYEGTK